MSRLLFLVLPTPGAAAVLCLLAVGAYGAWALLRALTSPLRAVPGPRAAGLTSAGLKWHEFGAGRTRYVHRLHAAYGPVVRVAPREVVFASRAAVREIYGAGGSGYDKTEFYNLFRVYGRRTMFSTLNKADHAKRKRVLADRYANTNIMRSAALDGIRERSSRFLERCSKSVGGSIDIFICLHDYAFDCVTHHLFHPYGSDSLRDEKDEAIMRQVAFDDSLQNRLLSYYNPQLHRVVARVLAFFAPPRETPLADNLVLTASAKPDPAVFTLLSRMQDKHHGMEHLDMAAECLDHMAAGIDTTGDGLCFLMWEMSQPRSLHVQKRLQAELRDHPDTPFDQLPYLDAVVTEGLRCFPAIPMSLPRYVPAGGRTIDGYFLPEGTIVSCQAYSTHRVDTDVFPDPDTFTPERWLDAEGDQDRRRLFFAFASGGRGCIGKHLALAEMKILLRDIYSRFTTLPDPSMTDADMAMADQLISSQPRAQRCLMKFVPLGAEDA